MRGERLGDLGFGGVPVGALFPVDLPLVAGVPEVGPDLDLPVGREPVAERADDVGAGGREAGEFPQR